MGNTKEFFSTPPLCSYGREIDIEHFLLKYNMDLQL